MISTRKLPAPLRGFFDLCALLLPGLLAGCGANGDARPISAGETVVIRTERAVSVDQVNAIAIPGPLGPRPSSASAAADQALAKMCDYTAALKVADLLVQHAAGMTPVVRVSEPVCEARSSSK